jgi:hypothetical protein
MKLIFIVLLCLIAVVGFAQDQAQVPPGVNYKTAPDSVNNAAKDALQKTLAGDKTASKQVLSDAITCGPMLWQALKGDADKRLVDAKKIIAVIGVPTPKATEGRTFAPGEERDLFWRQLSRKYPALAGARIRKATAWEISYFWATVPFDIQEPFFALEAGPDTFIANIRMSDGKPVLFWVDIVGNFQNLDLPQPATAQNSKN